MGIIVRQSLKRTTVTYVGQALGLLSILFIYPLAWETYGLAQFAIATASLLLPVATLGATSLTVRFFPDFQDGQTHHGFLGLLFFITAITFLLFTPLAIWLEKYFLSILPNLGMNPAYFQENRLLIYLLIFMLIIQSLLVSHASNFKRIVVPVVFTSFIHKIVLPALILLVFYKTIDLDRFKWGIILMYIMGAGGVLVYLAKLKQLSFKIEWSFLTKKLIKKMAVYSTFGFFTSLGSLLAFRIDSIMVTSYLGYNFNGFYSSFMFMTFVMVVPYQSIMAISNPIIAQAWQQQDYVTISGVYRKSAETLIVAGLMVFLGTWLCLEDLLSLTPKLQEQLPYRMAFFFLGLGQLINMSAGVNDPVISYSKYFKFNFIALIFLGLATVYTNYLLIPLYGMPGAAMATAIAFLLFNLVKLIFIKWKFDMQPFSLVHVKAIAIGLLSFAIAEILPLNFHPVINILLKGSAFVLMYGGAVVGLGISEEINRLYHNFRARLKNMLG